MSEILKTKATCCHGNSYQLILIYDMTYNYAGYETGVRRMTPTHVRMPGYIVSLISDPECHKIDTISRAPSEDSGQPGHPPCALNV